MPGKVVLSVKYGRYFNGLRVWCVAILKALTILVAKAIFNQMIRYTLQKFIPKTSESTLYLSKTH